MKSSDLEQALTNVINALVAARKALYEVSYAYDQAARDNILVHKAYTSAVVDGMHEGEARASAEAIDAVLTRLRKQRREEKRWSHER